MYVLPSMIETPGGLLPIEAPGEEPEEPDAAGAQSGEAMLGDLPHSARETVSRGLSREEYAAQRKHPQVEWMVRAVGELITTTRRHNGGRSATVVDIGGGRCDLAMRLATSFPDDVVTVVDRNPVALDSARQRGAGALPNLRLIQADLADPGLAKALQCDVVAALHACGGLTDAALRLAVESRAAFVVTPCCFNKNTELVKECEWRGQLGAGAEGICRLAECRRRDLSVRAMRVVNSIRLRALVAAGWTVRLASFSEKYSLRNQVLIGIPPYDAKP
eukprot:Hpha_TRINITY_DN569_c0_g1::TRINITY_DN569_c0_g1_i1::g.171711::m.171711